MDVVALLSSVPGPVVYVLVAVLVGVESLGVPVPGETALVAGALLSAHHQLPISPVAVAAAGAIGAIAGDSLGYLIGSRYGDRGLAAMQRRMPRHVTPERLGYVQDVFRRRGAWAVFGGRFVALLRMLAGPVSGAVRMPYPHFLLANAAGGLLWSAGIVGVIWTFGQAAQHWLSDAAWVALVIVLVLSVLFGKALTAAVDRRVAGHAADPTPYACPRCRSSGRGTSPGR